MALHFNNRSILVLISGTSGSGKTAVMNALYDNLINSGVLLRDKTYAFSTDTLRKEMRINMKDMESKYPLLYCSSFECGKTLLDYPEYQHLNEVQRNVIGY